MKRLAEVRNLEHAAAVLEWDQETYMPDGGAAARGEQIATLQRIRHERFTDEAVGQLIESATAEMADADPDSDEARLLKVTRQDYELATRLPADHVAEMARITSLAQRDWAKAREAKDFRLFQDRLTQIVDLKLKTAEYLGYESNPYDALIYEYERDLSTETISAIFAAHKPGLIDLIDAISAVSDRVDDAVLHQPFDVESQRAFGQMVIKQYGFDFERGRQDVAVHPFCTNFSRGDVRLTTRFDPEWLNPALFGTMHESGHGMYEQGIAERLDDPILGTGVSLSVHESQSRLWENIVGRSHGFWQWAFPKLQASFPALADVSLDAFYKAINRVKPSFIRVEADEATYNLHIMLRFELENDLINGRVAVKDLPREWNDRFEAFLGLTPPDDALGVLQDIHWSAGLMGYFPTYALGNLLSVQYYNQAITAHPTIPQEITAGKFDTLHGWLKENIYQHGRKFETDELTRRVTGGPIDSKPYLTYLRDKYTAIYDL